MVPIRGKKLEKTKCESMGGKDFPFFFSPKDLPLKFSLSNIGRSVENIKSLEEVE